MNKPQRINIREPLIGGKCWLLETKGLFILEEGAAAMRAIGCTHAGTGGLIIYDGVPDENGFFPDEDMKPDDPNYFARNGRPIYKANPAVMGAWMLDAGVIHGITVQAMGGDASANLFASLVWIKHKARVAPNAQPAK